MGSWNDTQRAYHGTQTDFSERPENPEKYKHRHFSPSQSKEKAVQAETQYKLVPPLEMGKGGS